MPHDRADEETQLGRDGAVDTGDNSREGFMRGEMLAEVPYRLGGGRYTYKG